MWGILRRAILPVVMLAVGIAALVHGVAKHTAHVFEEQEIEISLAPPPDMGGPPGMDGLPGMPGMGDLPGMEGMPPGLGGLDALSPFGAPPLELQKVKQKIFVGKDEREMAIVRDVTIGGLVLLESGELRRTYSGEPPSLCPT